MTHMCLVISGAEWGLDKDLAGELLKKHVDLIMKGEHFVTVWKEKQIETNVTLKWPFLRKSESLSKSIVDMCYRLRHQTQWPTYSSRLVFPVLRLEGNEKSCLLFGSKGPLALSALTHTCCTGNWKSPPQYRTLHCENKVMSVWTSRVTSLLEFGPQCSFQLLSCVIANMCLK